MRTPVRVTLLLLAAILAVTVIATPVLAKGPAIMIVSGRLLHKSVILSNWRENGTFMFAVSDDATARQARLSGRPYLQVAMYWGMTWVKYVNHHKSLTALHPNQADQFARFYPAYRGNPAIFAFDAIPGPYNSLIRRVQASGIAILRRHGIPVWVNATQGTLVDWAPVRHPSRPT